MQKSYFWLLILTGLLFGACQDPSPPIPDLWPPEMAGWTIEKVADLPVPIHNHILFFDEADAIVYRQGIWFSEDGGKTWTERSPQSGITVDAVSFQNRAEGTIAYHLGDGNNDPFAIYFAQTSDAGQNWDVYPAQKMLIPTVDLWMIDSFDGFMVGADGAGTPGLFQTFDGGISWERIEGIFPKFSNQTLRSANQVISFHDKFLGYVLGEKGEGWYTTADGGTSWAYHELDPFQIRAFQVMDPDTVYFNAERLYRSDNGGTSASFVGQEILDSFLAGSGGQVLATERVSEDLSDLSAPIYYFRLFWKDGKGGTTKSQSIANHYFTDFVQVSDSVYFGLSSQIREPAQAIYRLQRN
jgi:hypothetical protein